MVVLISDLLADPDMLRTQLGFLRSQGHEVVLLRVLDPSELDFKFAKPTMFIDVESGRNLYIDPDAARATYQRNFSAHAEQIAKSCRELGVDYHQISTAQPIELALFDYLQSRLHAGRSVTRTGRRAVRSGAA
jgi:uncharacterized protein (DUF58 family)